MKLSKAPTYQIQEADFNASDIPSRSTVPVSMVDPSSKISTIIPRYKLAAYLFLKKWSPKFLSKFFNSNDLGQGH